MDTENTNGLGDPDFTADELAALDALSKGQEPPAPTEQPEQPAEQPTEEQPAADGDQKPEDEQKADGEDKGEEDDDGRPRDEKGRYVPHKALHAEREKHKQTRAALREAELQATRYSERLAVLLEAVGPSKAEQKQEEKQPEFKPLPAEEDLLGAIKQLQDHLPQVNSLGQTVEQLRAAQQEALQAAQVAQLSTRYATDIATAKTSNPHFEDAIRHLVTQQDAMLAAQGWTDPAQRRAEIERAERALVTKAYQDGANPTERLLQIAKAVGWREPVAQPAGESKVGAKIDNLAKMARASASLSNTVSAGGEGMPTPAQIAAMDEEQFDAFVAKIGGDKAFERRYLGR